MSVAVFGSINMDMVVHTHRVPRAGETIIGKSFQTSAGGKGANQAVASAKSGVHTYMIGRVGNDVFGERLLKSLNSYGVDISNVITETNECSGVAMITIDDDIENRIIVIPGTNGLVNSEDISRLKDCINNVRVLLLQLEVPLDSVIAAAKLAHENDVTVILDPAPACQLPNDLLKYVSIITPNQTEAKMLAGFDVNDQQQAHRAVKQLIERGVNKVVIKMGSRGIYWSDGRQEQFCNAFKVEAIDTVAAGDAFNGALAASMLQANCFKTALKWALAAGALSVMKAGAQQAMPTLEEIQGFLDRKLA